MKPGFSVSGKVQRPGSWGWWGFLPGIAASLRMQLLGPSGLGVRDPQIIVIIIGFTAWTFNLDRRIHAAYTRQQFPADGASELGIYG